MLANARKGQLAQLANIFFGAPWATLSRHQRKGRQPKKSPPEGGFVWLSGAISCSGGFSSNQSGGYAGNGGAGDDAGYRIMAS